MTTTIPPELIDAIVEKVVDEESLKACALTASTLRYTSQRILLRTVTVDDRVGQPRTYSALCSLLEESPHVATYIRRLYMFFSESTGPSERSSVRQLLSQLKNVRRCTIGEGDHAYSTVVPWSGFVSMDMPAIIAFLQQQELVELNVWHFKGLSSTLVAIFACAAQSVSFFCVDADLEVDPTPSISHLNQLVISLHSSSVSRILGQPTFAFCTANVRRLGLNTESDTTAVQSSVAATLEHLRLNCETVRNTFPLLPPLPALRSVDLAMRWNAKREPWLVKILTSILISAPPTFEEISVILPRIHAMSERHLLQPAAATALRIALNSCDSDKWPTLRWRIPWEPPQHAVANARFFDEFAVSVQTGLPRLHARGKLVVERYSVREYDEEWASAESGR
ncbi:hypothetical protein C8R43DRAFT_991279 [Mycena crocata]|nr:hypothetical protein C8R43DRAFT_991279 [Mycena crocata]